MPQFEIPRTIIADDVPARNVDSCDCWNEAASPASKGESHALLLAIWHSRCKRMPDAGSRPNFEEDLERLRSRMNGYRIRIQLGLANQRRPLLRSRHNTLLPVRVRKVDIQPRPYRSRNEISINRCWEKADYGKSLTS